MYLRRIPTVFNFSIHVQITASLCIQITASLHYVYTSTGTRDLLGPAADIPQAGAGGNRREREGGREAEHGVLLMGAAEDRSTGTSGTATVTTVYSTSLFFN